MKIEYASIAAHARNRRHELRITDKNRTWRVVYRIDADAIVLLEVFDKTTNRTPNQIIDNCKKRIGYYDENS